MRVYQPPDIRVVKAIRCLGAEISSLALARKPKGDEDDGKVWIACGTEVSAKDVARSDQNQIFSRFFSLVVGQKNSFCPGLMLWTHYLYQRTQKMF